MSIVVLLHYNPASPISLPGGPVVGSRGMVFWHDNRVCVRVCSTAQNGLA